MMVVLRGIEGIYDFSVKTSHHWCCHSKMKFLEREKYDIKYIKNRNRLIKLEILILRLKNWNSIYCAC